MDTLTAALVKTSLTKASVVMQKTPRGPAQPRPPPLDQAAVRLRPPLCPVSPDCGDAVVRSPAGSGPQHRALRCRGRGHVEFFPVGYYKESAVVRICELILIDFWVNSNTLKQDY